MKAADLTLNSWSRNDRYSSGSSVIFLSSVAYRTAGSLSFESSSSPMYGTVF